MRHTYIYDEMDTIQVNVGSNNYVIVALEVTL